GTVCVVGKIRDLILQLSKSSIYSTKPSHYTSCYFLQT
ncbi:PTS fructose IIA subunit, partial [Klebsiella pneumoniae]|nr:PTS fructose IIA subunit [Klebsiella pneumoniae]